MVALYKELSSFPPWKILEAFFPLLLTACDRPIIFGYLLVFIYNISFRVLC